MAQHEVEVLHRNPRVSTGWASWGLRRFHNLGGAKGFLLFLVEEYKDALGPDLKIEVRIRKGRVVVFTVGGRVENPTEIVDWR